MFATLTMQSIVDELTATDSFGNHVTFVTFYLLNYHSEPIKYISEFITIEFIFSTYFTLILNPNF